MISISSCRRRLIAQTPLERRDGSRLLVLDKATGETEHRHFYDLPEYLRPGDCLILNNSRVLPARLLGHRVPGGGACEILLLIDKGDNVGMPGAPRQKAAEGRTGILRRRGADRGDRGRAARRQPAGAVRISGIFLEVLELGKMPLPPYIKEELQDRERYQTVYSRSTALRQHPRRGCTSRRSFWSRCSQIGVKVGYVTLHVGLGTFRP